MSAPMFSKRHYVALAATLRATRPAVASTGREQWSVDVAELVDLFARDNARFARDSFLTAVLREQV